MAKKPTFPNNQRNNRQPNQVVATQTVTHYEGAVPHPDILRGFDQLVPGSAERLIKLAETESLHRRGLEAAALHSNIENQQKQIALNEQQSIYVFRSDIVGQILGLFVCTLCILAATYLGLKDHDVLAGAIAAVPTGALIKAFVLNKK